MKYDNHASADNDDHSDHDNNTYHLDVLEPLLYLNHVLSVDTSVLCTSAMPPQL
jgi:hypothetical protein